MVLYSMMGERRHVQCMDSVIKGLQPLCEESHACHQYAVYYDVHSFCCAGNMAAHCTSTARSEHRCINGMQHCMRHGRILEINTPLHEVWQQLLV